MNHIMNYEKDLIVAIPSRNIFYPGSAVQLFLYQVYKLEPFLEDIMGIIPSSSSWIPFFNTHPHKQFKIQFKMYIMTL